MATECLLKLLWRVFYAAWWTNHLELAVEPWLMLLLFLPCPLPFPPPRHYDSLDSATNGRSDLDSASGSSRRTSRQYSLDSRRSLSDRWVFVAPLPPPYTSFYCSSLWFHAAVMMSWIWTCLVLWSLLCLHACAQSSSFTCIIYIDYIHIYFCIFCSLHIFMLCRDCCVINDATWHVILMCLTECFWFLLIVLFQVSLVRCTVKTNCMFSSGRLLFACLLLDRVRGRLCGSVCLTSARVIAEQLKSPCSELAAGKDVCIYV